MIVGIYATLGIFLVAIVLGVLTPRGVTTRPQHGTA
jgi:hypothetical protein